MVESNLTHHPSTASLSRQRRRTAAALAKLVADLDQDCARPDLHVYCHPILDGIRELLDLLADAEQEGGSREVLRLIRNSMMNGNLEAYRRAPARAAVVGALQTLADSEVIRNEQVRDLGHRLRAATLNTVAAPLPFVGEDEDGEEAEVPD